MTIFFSQLAIPHAFVEIINCTDGKAVRVAKNGYIGTFKSGTKLVMYLQVANVEHSCYLLNNNPDKTKTPKPQSFDNINIAGFLFDDTPSGIVFNGKYYRKNFTVIEKKTRNTTSSQISAWPSNMLCLDIDSQTWNIGICCQNGRYFLVIEKYCPIIEVNELLPVGTVLSSSPLRGVAAINTGSTIFNARLHWSNMPIRYELGFRGLCQGEVIKFKNDAVIELDGSSSFRYEIKRCSLA